jgi:hypothetical protein
MAQPEDPKAISPDAEGHSEQALAQILESARTLGVEIDEEEALQWLAAMAALGGNKDEVSYNEEEGIFGHRVVLLDFDPADLERVRRVAAIIELEDRPNVETAIALSGSSAQSHVQTFPGDFDYFERVNIKAPSRKAACAILKEVIRDKVLGTLQGPGYQLIDVRFGSYRHTVIRGGDTLEPGSSIVWSAAEIQDGSFEVLTPDGQPMIIDWDYAAVEPGWCKLDWVIVDPAHPRAVKASNMLDVTWEGPDGTLVPLDGFIDPYYQEVYLQAESIPLFSKISKQLKPDSLQHYVEQMEHEILKYSQGDHANYGKVAKRLYNVFRLTGRYEEAAFVRELFDEPAALLYQIGALFEGMAELGDHSATIDRETLSQQVDDIIRDISAVAEGPSETELIMSLLRVRDDISGLKDLGDAWEETLYGMQDSIMGLVNEYFEKRLRGVPELDAYLNSLA